MLWMDEWTEEQIGFLRIKNAIRPMTLYGQMQKAARRPFISGEEAAWQADHEDALRLFSRLEKQSELASRLSIEAHSLNGSFQGMPDVRTAVALLTLREPLAVGDVVSLKRFCAQVQELAMYLDGSAVDFTWWTVFQIDRILEILSPGNAQVERDFSLLDLRDPGYHLALREWQHARAQKMSATRDFLRSIGKDFGVAVRRDDTLVLSLDDTDKVLQAKADARLKERLQSPFDVVFEPVWPSVVANLTHTEQVQSEHLAKEEQRLLIEVSVKLAPFAQALEAAMVAIGRLDELYARVRLAGDVGYTWSQLGTVVKVTGGHQPEAAKWTRIDTFFHTRVALLTGPNMGGKTAAQKTWLFLQASHQMGYPVPAKAFEAPLFNGIRYVGGDAQSLLGGLSSFGAEVIKLGEALSLSNAMICLDEIGRHTNPEEGLALITALLEELLLRTDGSYVLATHFSLPLKQGVQYLRVAGLKDGVIGEKTDLDGDQEKRLEELNQAMDYRILEVGQGTVPKQGLQIAKWLGLSKTMISRAEEIMRENQYRSE